LAGQTSQSANSIIINATGSILNGTNQGTYIAPVRNDTGSVTNTLYYNTSTKEVTYAQIGAIATGYFTGNQAIANNTPTTVLFNTASGSQSSWYNPATGQFTPTIAGTYLVSVGVSWSPAVGTGATQIQIQKNGTGSLVSTYSSIDNVNQNSQPVIYTVVMNGTTDYLTVIATTATTDLTQNIFGQAQITLL